MARTDRRLAWIVLAVLACAAILGFGRGLSQAVADASARRSGGGLGAPQFGGEPRTASALPTLDEPRVRQIAREEAEAAVGRARPRKAAAPKTADDDDTTATPDDPQPGAGPSAPDPEPRPPT